MKTRQSYLHLAVQQALYVPISEWDRWPYAGGTRVYM